MFSGINFQILDGHTMAGLHGVNTNADTKSEERIYLNRVARISQCNAAGDGG